MGPPKWAEERDLIVDWYDRHAVHQRSGGGVMSSFINNPKLAPESLTEIYHVDAYGRLQRHPRCHGLQATPYGALHKGSVWAFEYRVVTGRQGVFDVEVKSNRCYQYYDDEAAADAGISPGGGNEKANTYPNQRVGRSGSTSSPGTPCAGRPCGHSAPNGSTGTTASCASWRLHTTTRPTWA